MKSNFRALIKLHFALLFLSVLASNSTRAADLTYAPGPADNPMKGFVAESWNGASARPHSLEHVYVAFADVMTGPSTYNWSVIDNQLSATNGRGNHLVVRVYLDYPRYASTFRNRGVPQWLINAGVAMRSYDDGQSFSPDYENPTLRTAMRNFIAAMGARYDGHAGLGFVELGLLGMFGEWHVFINPSWEASTTVQDEVFAAYRAAFTRTRILVSGDAAPRQVGAIGYHTGAIIDFRCAPMRVTFTFLATSAEAVPCLPISQRALTTEKIHLAKPAVI